LLETLDFHDSTVLKYSYAERGQLKLVGWVRIPAWQTIFAPCLASCINWWVQDKASHVVPLTTAALTTKVAQ